MTTYTTTAETNAELPPGFPKVQPPVSVPSTSKQFSLGAGWMVAFHDERDAEIHGCAMSLWTINGRNVIGLPKVSMDRLRAAFNGAAA